MNKIGITSTVPVEVLLAAGLQPVDLNNIFISDGEPERLVRDAERHGFPLNTCTWIKGIFSAALERKIETVIGVTSGDCSNTLMLLEVLELHGVKAIPFAYPCAPDPAEMVRKLESLASIFGTNILEAENSRQGLQKSRGLLAEIDRLTWQENRVSGLQNHYWLVSGSDFNGDPAAFCAGAGAFVAEVRQRQPYPDGILRLAFCGVPAVYGRELYAFLETKGARVVFNEIQRQFAMVEPAKSLAEQYSAYTYPYATAYRIADIARECEKRRVDGIMHYVQTFCHRAIGDIVFRHRLKYPILTLEGSTEFFLTQHTKTRLEAFLDMLGQHREKNNTREGEPWLPK
jgi:benzoyl-CoA reductase/2-hydroxyglutaryl-CoA dehydratase subunit BcrC/BadD/HgdB